MPAAPLADLYRRALALGARFPGPDALGVNAALAALQLDQADRQRAGAQALWTSPLVPAELATALGLLCITPETVAAVLASAGRGSALLDRAGGALAAADCCSFQRVAAAALEAGAVPIPQAFVSCTTICDDNAQLAAWLAERHQRPSFLIDVPAGDDAAARAHVTRQLGAFIVFLEKLAGQPLDPHRLALAVEASNRARRGWLEVNRLRREQPPVMPGVAALRLAGGLVLQKLGQPELADALEGWGAELRGRIGAGAFLPLKRRLLWLHLFPLYDREFMRLVETELGLVVAFEESSHLWWDEIDPRDPLPGLAARICGAPLGGAARRRADTVLRLAREYRADGVVHFSHGGCRTLSGGAPLIGAALREAGVPFLELAGDCLDERSGAPALWRTRLEAFAELLEARARRGRP